jgi:hypothetical protein
MVTIVPSVPYIPVRIISYNNVFYYTIQRVYVYIFFIIAYVITGPTARLPYTYIVLLAITFTNYYVNVMLS